MDSKAGLLAILGGLVLILYNKYRGNVIDKLKNELNVAKEDTTTAALDQKQKDIEVQIVQEQPVQHVVTDDKTTAENIDKI